MNRYLEDIREFHKMLGNQPFEGRPDMRTSELRANLIEEEAKETVDAIRRLDFIEAIDGLIDTLVVVYGTFVAFGVDPDPFWDEVHRTNMAKKSGPIREDGKNLKPEGWQPPRIGMLLIEQMEAANVAGS